MRINAARYFIIYHFGGMYLDIDMECKVNSIFPLTKKTQEDYTSKNRDTKIRHIFVIYADKKVCAFLAHLALLE